MKRLYIITFIFLLITLLTVSKRVYAQDNGEFPDRYVRLNYVNHEFVQENEETYEYMVTYSLPFKVYDYIPIDYYIFFYRIAYGFTRGLVRTNNSYVLETFITEPNYSEFHFRFTLRKTMVHTEYLEDDLYEDLIPFFTEHSAMFIRDSENFYEDVYNQGFNDGIEEGYNIGYDDGVQDGIKSITNKPIAILLQWIVPFVTLVIISGIYIGFKKEWFHSD